MDYSLIAIIARNIPTPWPEVHVHAIGGRYWLGPQADECWISLD